MGGGKEKLSPDTPGAYAAGDLRGLECGWATLASVEGHAPALGCPAGHLRVALQGHRAVVYGLAFTPDSRSLLSGSEDGTLRLWDVERGEALRVLQGYEAASTMSPGVPMAPCSPVPVPIPR